MVINKVAIFYGHVASNIGDLAINSGELLAIRSVFPKAAVKFIALHVSEGPKFEQAKAEISAIGEADWFVYRTSFRHIIDYQTDPNRFLVDCGVDDYDLILLASGEHLFSYNEQHNSRSLYWRTLPAFAAKSSGKPCLMFPSTFGPFETSISKAWMSHYLTLIGNVAVREADSRAYLTNEFNVDTSLLPDPAFFLQPQINKSFSCTAIDTLGIAMRAEDWGIRVPDDKRNDATKQKTSVAPVAASFTTELIRIFLAERPNAQVKIFVQTEADRGLAELVCEQISLSQKVTVVEPTSIADYFSVLAGVDALVASRFHAIIMGLKVGLPVRGVYFSAHGHKMPGLFSLLDIPDACAEISDDPKLIADKTIRSLLADQIDWQKVALRIEEGKKDFCNWLKKAKFSAKSKSSLYPASLAFNALGNELIKLGYEQDKQAAIRKLKDKINELHEDNNTLKASPASNSELAKEFSNVLSFDFSLPDTHFKG